MQGTAMPARSAAAAQAGSEARLAFSPTCSGAPLTIGEGFTALQFRHDDFPSAAMSPFVMVDHFQMWRPTFDVHPHAGMSAVTLVLEDTKGRMLSRDSLGHEASIGAGDLHWTLAGRGILHTQLPANPEARIHALQIFVNLPTRSKGVAPNSFHVAAADMPVIQWEGTRVRIVAGELFGRKSPAQTPEPVLMLDGYVMASPEPLSFPIAPEWNAWIHVVDGELCVGNLQHVAAGQAICVSASLGAGLLSVRTESTAHFVVLCGPRIDEPVIQHGPFVFESQASLAQAIANLRAGRFGHLEAP